MECASGWWNAVRERVISITGSIGWQLVALVTWCGVVLVAAVVPGLYGLYDRTFAQQFVSTFFGVILAAGLAIWLHRWQEGRAVRARLAEDRRLAREVLLNVKDEAEENQKRLDQMEKELPKGMVLYYRTYTDVMQDGGVRLVPLLKEHAIAAKIRRVIYEYDLLNRKLDAQFEIAYSGQMVEVRYHQREELVASIVKQVPDLRGRTERLVSSIDEKLQELPE